MSLSTTTIRKFFRETLGGEPVEVKKNQQKAWLKKLQKEKFGGDGVSADFTTEYINDKNVEVPKLRVFISKSEESKGQYYSEHGIFIVGFPDGGTQLMAEDDGYYYGNKKPPAPVPVSDVSQIDDLTAAIKERIRIRILKQQKKSTSDQFTTQGLKAKLKKLAVKHQFDFGIKKMSNQFVIYVSKRGIKFQVMIKLSTAKAKVDEEFERLEEYIKHAMVHLDYCGKIHRPMGKGYSSFQGNWTKYDE